MGRQSDTKGNEEQSRNSTNLFKYTARLSDAYIRVRARHAKLKPKYTLGEQGDCVYHAIEFNALVAMPMSGARMPQRGPYLGSPSASKTAMTSSRPSCPMAFILPAARERARGPPPLARDSRAHVGWNVR